MRLQASARDGFCHDGVRWWQPPTGMTKTYPGCEALAGEPVERSNARACLAALYDVPPRARLDRVGISGGVRGDREQRPRPMGEEERAGKQLE